MIFHGDSTLPGLMPMFPRTVSRPIVWLSISGVRWKSIDVSFNHAGGYLIPISEVTLLCAITIEHNVSLSEAELKEDDE